MGTKEEQVLGRDVPFHDENKDDLEILL